jgi:hypothetical protein
MTHRLPALVAAAVLAAAAAPADACPRKLAFTSPAAGGLLHEGEAIFVERHGVRRLPSRAELILWSPDHQITLDVERAAGGRLRLLPEEPLTIGQRYHLALAASTDPGWSALRELPPTWWTAAEPDRQAQLLGLAGRLALFGALPFAVGYLGVRKVIIRRRRRAIDAL